MDEKTALNKLINLVSYIKGLEKVSVAYSGGVDSTFLLKVCKDTLGKDAIALTISSNLMPGIEADEALDFCKENHINQHIIEIDEISIDGFSENPPNRCYICKKHIFSSMKAYSEKLGFMNIVEGSNLDDKGDYRPGKIAIKELNIISPLEIVGLTKEEIRYLSKRMDLKTWDKPSMACLASRIPYGEEITRNKLLMVGKGEDKLRELGFKQFRVRVHGNIARIEVYKDDFEKLLSNSEYIVSEFKELGFDYVTMDLQGFRSGSMNETLNI